MSRLSITIDKEGVQILSFLGKTVKEREGALEIYSALENEIKTLDKKVKDHFSNNQYDLERITTETEDEK